MKYEIVLKYNFFLGYRADILLKNTKETLERGLYYKSKFKAYKETKRYLTTVYLLTDSLLEIQSGLRDVKKDFKKLNNLKEEAEIKIKQIMERELRNFMKLNACLVKENQQLKYISSLIPEQEKFCSSLVIGRFNEYNSYFQYCEHLGWCLQEKTDTQKIVEITEVANLLKKVFGCKNN